MVAAAVVAVGWRGRRASGDRFLVSSPGACGVLASVRRTSMMKWTNEARGVFLGTSGTCESVSVPVGKLRIAVGLND